MRLCLITPFVRFIKDYNIKDYIENDQVYEHLYYVKEAEATTKTDKKRLKALCIHVIELAIKLSNVLRYFFREYQSKVIIIVVVI